MVLQPRSLPNFQYVQKIILRFFIQLIPCRRENTETLERILTILFEQFKHIYKGHYEEQKLCRKYANVVLHFVTENELFPSRGFILEHLEIFSIFSKSHAYRI